MASPNTNQNRLAVMACSGALALAAGTIALGQRSEPDSKPIRAEIRHVEDALPRFADRGAALYLLARRYAQLGDIDRAHALLDECLARREGFEPAADAFQPLQKFLDIRSFTNRFRRAHPEIHRARIAFTDAEEDLFPEGLAFDPASQYRRSEAQAVNDDACGLASRDSQLLSRLS